MTTTEAAKPPATEAAKSPKEGESLLNKDAKPSEKPAGAPEKYEAFKMPEGFTIDEPTTKEVSELFKTMGLSQEQGQSLIDFHTAKTKAAAEAPHKAYAEMRAGWTKEVYDNPKLGDGKTLRPEVKTSITAAINSLPTDLGTKFRAAMDVTGVGDHPAFVEAFYEFSKRFSEGTSVQGKGPAKEGQAAPSGPPPSAAKALYPNLA